MANYSGLSRLMSDNPDLLILRTFRTLNVKNLLYYQAELAHLEHELEEVEKEDRDCDNSLRSEHAVSWKSLKMVDGSCASPPKESLHDDPRDALQWQIFSRARVILHQYSKDEALLNIPLESAGI